MGIITCQYIGISILFLTNCVKPHYSQHLAINTFCSIHIHYQLCGRHGIPVSQVSKKQISKKEVTVQHEKCFNRHKHRGLQGKGAGYSSNRKQSVQIIGNNKE